MVPWARPILAPPSSRYDGGMMRRFPEKREGRLAGGLRRSEATTSALRELFALARLVQTHLLALDLARVARDEPRLRQRRLQRRVVVDERARDAVADRTGLAGLAAALDVDHDVEGRLVVRQLERLADHHAARVARKELVGGLLVDDDVAAALLQEDARDGALAAAGAVVVVADHGIRGRGFSVAAPRADASSPRST